MVNEPGIYQLSMEEYHADPCPVPSLSRSIIRDLLYRSPGHARHNHPRLNPDYQKDTGDGKFDLGTAAHSLLLSGADNVTVIEAEDWRTKAAREAREAAYQNGKTPLLESQFEELKKCVVRVEEQIYGCKELGIQNLRADGKAEQSYFWKEGETTWMRCRPDWISNDGQLILDCKFTDMNVNPEIIDRHVTSMGYEIQNAFYVQGVNTVQGHSPKFVFIFAERSEPFFCSFIGLSPQFLDMGKQKVDYGKFLWEQCLAKNEWPAYPNRIAYLEPPAWALSAWESIAEKIGI